MSGTIRRMIDTLIEKKTRGNPALVESAKAKLILKGLNPDSYTPSSPDDPAVMEKLRGIAAEMGIPL